MQLLLTILTTLLAGTLVVLVPGAALLATMRLDRIVPPPLVPAAAVALGLVPLALLTAGTLLAHRPIEFVVGGLAILVLACWGSIAGRVRREAKESRARARVRGWWAPVRSLVAGEWLRATPPAAIVLALLGGVLAVLVGFYAWNDSLYHIGQAQKLLALDAPTLDNTLQFEDGSAHPGYFVPVWQEAIALTAFIARVDPVTAAWILPGVTFPVSLLAFGGLGWAAARSRAATSVVTAALLVVTIGTLPTADPIINAMHPGTVALGILAPLVLAMLFTALWPEDQPVAGPRAPRWMSPRDVHRAATWLAAVATAGVGLLHVGYLWVLGFGILGYVLVWALRSPWPRAVVRRHLFTGAVIAVVAAACLALLLPGLNRLENIGIDAQAELERNESVQYEGENAANLDALLRGDPEGAFHLRADYLVLAGGLALLGLLVIPLCALAPRWPGGWYLLGAGTLVLGIALSDQLFPAFVNVVTLDQARRIERVLPLVLALGVGALAIGAATSHLWKWGAIGWRVAAVALPIAAAIAGMRVVDTTPRLAGYTGDTIVEPRVIVWVLVALLVALVLLFVQRRLGREVASWEWPTALLDRGATLVALAVLLVAAAPVYASIGDVVDSDRLDKLPADMRTAELRIFAPNVARELRRLPPGSVVLADPRSNTRDAYLAMALAPVYVVSSVPRHTALTPENRVDERFEIADSFFRGDFQSGLSLRERLRILEDEHVDAVLVHPFGAADIRRHLERSRDWRLAARGTNQQLLVRRGVGSASHP